eukprot:1307105-Rhodomonas_salina.2
MTSRFQLLPTYTPAEARVMLMCFPTHSQPACSDGSGSGRVSTTDALIQVCLPTRALCNARYGHSVLCCHRKSFAMPNTKTPHRMVRAMRFPASLEPDGMIAGLRAMREVILRTHYAMSGSDISHSRTLYPRTI